MRLLLASGRIWLALLLAATLLARLLVPAGFMPATAHGMVSLRLCPGTAAMPAMAAMPGEHHRTSHGGDHGKVEAPCAFAGLGLAMVGPVGPALLAATALFAVVQGLLALTPLSPVPPGRLRPPLRAPPLPA